VFMFLIFYAVTLFVMCVVLIPTDLADVSDFSSYFMSLRSWFFGGVILLILVDFADSAAKGWENVVDLGIGYILLRSFLLVGALAAIRTEKRFYHGGFAVVAFLWTFVFFWSNRPQIEVG